MTTVLYDSSRGYNSSGTLYDGVAPQIAGSPTYRIVMRACASYSSFDGNIGAVVEIFENATNIGYTEIVGNVPVMFFTLSQDDAKAAIFGSETVFNSSNYPVPYHFQVWRNDELVWGGWGPMELDENGNDIIIYSYGYAAALYWTLAGWKEEYTNQTVAAIVSAAFSAGQAKTSSMLAWLTAGQIEAPVTTSGGHTAITLPFYQANYKRLLFLIQELVAYSASDTTNRVWFEITPDGTFNLWRNKGANSKTPLLMYPGSSIGAVGRYRMPVDVRTGLYGVGTSPTDVDLQSIQSNTTMRDKIGLREDSIYMQWVRDQDELDRVTKRRMYLANRVDTQLSISLVPGNIAPIRATNGLRLMHDYPVYLNGKGSLQYRSADLNRMVVGNQVLFVGGREYVRPVLQDVPA